MRFFFGAGSVQFEEAGQNLVVVFILPSAPPGFSAHSDVGVVFLAVLFVFKNELRPRL